MDTVQERMLSSEFCLFTTQKNRNLGIEVE